MVPLIDWLRCKRRRTKLAAPVPIDQRGLWNSEASSFGGWSELPSWTWECKYLGSSMSSLRFVQIALSRYPKRPPASLWESDSWCAISSLICSGERQETSGSNFRNVFFTPTPVLCAPRTCSCKTSSLICSGKASKIPDQCPLPLMSPSRSPISNITGSLTGGDLLPTQFTLSVSSLSFFFNSSFFFFLFPPVLSSSVLFLPSSFDYLNAVIIDSFLDSVMDFIKKIFLIVAKEIGKKQFLHLSIVERNEHIIKKEFFEWARFLSLKREVVDQLKASLPLGPRPMWIEPSKGPYQEMSPMDQLLKQARNILMMWWVEEHQERSNKFRSS